MLSTRSQSAALSTSLPGEEAQNLPRPTAKGLASRACLKHRTRAITCGRLPRLSPPGLDDEGEGALEGGERQTVTEGFGEANATEPQMEPGPFPDCAALHSAVKQWQQPPPHNSWVVLQFLQENATCDS